MTREEFIKICGLFGLSIPLQGAISNCSPKEDLNVNFFGKVVIIGAGAGGLSAGYLLKQHGVDFEILEASDAYGGRMKINRSFADFPIALGAEWLETDTGIFQRIANDPDIDVHVDTHPDPPDRKFVNYSWFQFFEDYIYPSISDKIRFNTIVESIDYSDDQVIITTDSGQLSADKVVISVPLKILQDGDISFDPPLPENKISVINDLPIWDGFKAFIEFSEKFYDEEYVFEVNPETAGEKIYYDATLGQNTEKHILGLFVVGTPVQQYAGLSDSDLIAYILAELDELYDDKASSSYLKHLSQNWNDEPFIKAGYISDHADWRKVKMLSEPVNNKVYFAGGAYTNGEDWVSVHTASESAKSAVNKIVF